MPATNFEYGGHATSGKGICLNLLEKLLKSHHVSLVLADFSHLEAL